MGFVTGFTGGVTLTLSLAYLTVLTHQRNREHQSAAIRAMTLVNSQLVDPIPVPLPPTRSEVAVAQRATSIEVVKDRWNQEVMNAVRWVQYTDWDQVREELEDTASRLWSKAFGNVVSETAEEAMARLEAATKKARQEAEKKRQDVVAAAKSTWKQAKDKAEELELSAENKAWEARLQAGRTFDKAQETVKEKASEARVNAKQTLHKAQETAEEKAAKSKGVIASAIESGREAAEGILRSAKAAVGIAGQKVEAVMSGESSSDMTPVQKALQQRYEQPEALKKQTVAEVLSERYQPVDQRDNTVLRGV